MLFVCLPVCECTYVCVGYGVKWLQELVISESSTLYRYTGAVPYNSCVLHNYVHYVCLCHASVDRLTVGTEPIYVCIYVQDV